MPQARKQLEAGKLAVGYPSRRDEAVLDAGGMRCASVLWSFSADGGAADAAIGLGRRLPQGAVVVRMWSDEIVAVTGATDADLQVGSTAINSSAMDLTGDAGIQSRAATPYKVSDADGEEISVIFNTAAATAGEVRFFVEYLLPTDE